MATRSIVLVGLELDMIMTASCRAYRHSDRCWHAGRFMSFYSFGQYRPVGTSTRWDILERVDDCEQSNNQQWGTVSAE